MMEKIYSHQQQIWFFLLTILPLTLAYLSPEAEAFISQMRSDNQFLEDIEIYR